MMLFMQIAGGVALILFGVRFLRKGLDRLFGRRLAPWVRRMTQTRGHAFVAGLGLSSLISSSTSVSLLTLQMVRDGHATPRRMLAFIIGADIGLTALVLLGSLHLDEYGFIPIAIGCVAFQFFKNNIVRGAGQLLLSIGFIFYGITTIRAGGGQIDPAGDLIQLIQIAERYPVLLAFIAAVLTVAMQSSTAAILLVIGLGGQGAFGLPVAIAAIAGANVGTGLTMTLLAWRQRDTLRLAACNLTAKLLTATIVLSGLPFWALLLAEVPLPPAQQAALGHTSFNLMLAVLALPAVGLLDALMRWLIPDLPADPDSKPFGPRHLNTTPPQSMAIGLGHAMREVLHVSEIVARMLDVCWRGLRDNDTQALASIAEMDDRVDFLDHAVKEYLVRLLGESGEDDANGESLRQMRFLTELETIGDIIDINLCELAGKKIRHDLEFSKQTLDELEDYYQKVCENLAIATTAFHTGDERLAGQLVRHKSALNQRYNQLRDGFLDRMRLGQSPSLDAGAIYLDLLANLRRINSCLTHIAFVILDIEPTLPSKVLLTRDGSFLPMGKPANA